MRQAPGRVTVNWYGPGTITVPLADGQTLSLEQSADYPRENLVRLKLGLAAPAKFGLRLRIPHWSRKTRLRLNDMTASGVEGGRYITLERTWSPGDVVTLELDFSLQFWAGEQQSAGKAAIYRGPLLLAYDRRYNDCDPEALPALTPAGLSGRIVESGREPAPYLLMEFTADDGRVLRLCDFGSAGFGGSPYLSWLPVTACTVTPFSRQNPRRSTPIASAPTL